MFQLTKPSEVLTREMLGTGLMFELIVTNRALASIIVDFLCLLCFFLVRHDCSKTDSEKSFFHLLHLIMLCPSVTLYYVSNCIVVFTCIPDVVCFWEECPSSAIHYMSMKVNVYYVLSWPAQGQVPGILSMWTICMQAN